MCLNKLYKWAWWGAKVGNEMLTPQFRRLAKARPVFFWGAVGTITAALGAGLSGAIWFILHIVGIC